MCSDDESDEDTSCTVSEIAVGQLLFDCFAKLCVRLGRVLCKAFAEGIELSCMNIFQQMVVLTERQDRETPGFQLPPAASVGILIIIETNLDHVINLPCKGAHFHTFTLHVCMPYSQCEAELPGPTEN